MLTKVTLLCLSVPAMFLIAPASATAQQTILSSELSRLSGTEASSHIEYVRLFLRGSLLSHPTVSANGKASSLNVSAQPGIAGASDGATAVVLPSSDFAAASVPTKEPMLIAQCTRGASGKLAFELLANFGGVDDLAYYPPWTPADSHDLFPPQLQKPNMTMEFLGYTHVKPVKRQWEALLQPVGQYRYNPPSGGSANMEDSTYYLRYLLALPTLHLTLMEKTAEFRTTPLLDQIRREPLCKASLL